MSSSNASKQLWTSSAEPLEVLANGTRRCSPLVMVQEGESSRSTAGDVEACGPRGRVCRGIAVKPGVEVDLLKEVIEEEAVASGVAVAEQVREVAVAEGAEQ